MTYSKCPLGQLLTAKVSCQPEINIRMAAGVDLARLGSQLDESHGAIVLSLRLLLTIPSPVF